jgi:hypothetical protein
MTARGEVDVDDRAAAGRPLALDAVEAVVDVEHQVVASAFDDGPQHDDAELDGLRRDRRLGDGALEGGLRHARRSAEPYAPRRGAASAPR